ncbi:YhfC family intramembrane metalloprotease [Priestia megaterium]|nr:YhfC family intramembrane metalloprotease [Priestia megaterium]
MVNSISITMMVVSGILSLLTPVILAIYFKKRYQMKWKPLMLGVVSFVLFSQVIGNSVNLYILNINGTTSKLLDNPFLYALYGGFSASFFEEVGRFILILFLLKKYLDWKDGISYGIGHGGIEAVLVGGISAIQNVSTSLMINSGAFEKIQSSSQANNVINLDAIKA